MDRNLFGFPARSGMAKKDPAGKDAELAQRLRAVMAAEDIKTQKEFAAKLGVETKRLNNALVGYTLSVELAQKIKRLVPGMTRDWLYDGDEDGLPVSLRDRLREAVTSVRGAAGRS